MYILSTRRCDMIEYDFKRASTLEDGVNNLYTILSHLRSPEGCPWDREQTNESVSLDLLEELYEYLDTLKSKNIEGSAEELGDLFLNTFMLARIHEEQNEFTPVEAINLVCEKLIRRHPHVFGDIKASNPEEVLKVWNKVKADVEGKKESDEDFFSRIPRSMDKLETALKMQKKMKQVGFDWPNIEGVIEKIDEEKAELIEAIEKQTNIEEELGDLLFAVVNLARFLGLDPALALHRSNQKVRHRFNSVVKHCKEHAIELNYENVDLLNTIWEKVKGEDYNKCWAVYDSPPLTKSRSLTTLILERISNLSRWLSKRVLIRFRSPSIETR